MVVVDVSRKSLKGASLCTALPMVHRVKTQPSSAQPDLRRAILKAGTFTPSSVQNANSKLRGTPQMVVFSLRCLTYIHIYNREGNDSLDQTVLERDMHGRRHHFEEARVERCQNAGTKKNSQT